ncbi:MAG: hypothetical protein JO228_10930 [Xanthobacteraceae bacterium]|nr:hypothetical protein [Xanthobacteraceae bacterium]
MTDPIPTDKVVRLVALRRLGEALRSRFDLPASLPERLSGLLQQLDRPRRNITAGLCAASKAVDAADDSFCPVCQKPMRLLTIIKRGRGEQALVLQCSPCGLSTTITTDAAGEYDQARDV